MALESKYKFAALCPPTEKQWRKIYEFSCVDNYFHWKHYLLMSKLPSVHAIVCSTVERDEYIGLVLFIEPETVHITYVGNFLVNEQYRGKGVGSKIWSVMLQHTDSSRVIILNSYEAMAIKYRAKDIPVAGRTFQRLHGDTRQLLQALNQWMEQRPQLRDSYYPKDINSNETIDTVLSYDKKLAHFDRSSFMKIFFPLADHKKALFNSQGEVIAVAATFPLFHENDYKLEQVYADNFDLALMVLHALLQDVNATNFSLLTPDETENEQKFIDFLVKQANCSLIKQAHRSYSREFHCPIDWNRVFAMIGRGQIASPLA